MKINFKRRLATMAATIVVATAIAVVTSSQSHLQFRGMATVFGTTKYDKSGLLRQADCSLTQYGFSVSTRMLIPAADFQDTLHGLAGLGTKPDVFAKGCKDPVLGVASTATAYLGKTAAGLYQAAQGATDHEPNLVVYAANPGSLTFTSTTLAANVSPQILGVDLNKDGFVDVIATGVADSATGQNGVGVFLNKGDGTFKAGVVYPMTTSPNQAFIIDDLNGDGVPDILVPSTSSGGSAQLTALLGKGDGSFAAGPTTAITLDVSFSLYGLSQPIATGDFNGDGKTDVLTVDGKLYLGKGDGSFGTGTQVLPTSRSIVGAFAVGDFNGDGKLDLAELVTGINASGTVIVFLGQGDGTFKQGPSYDSIPEGSALVATDIDGDGNLDLVVARSSNGAFGAAGLGNASTANTWFYQVLMGHGDGTFDGAPVTAGGANGVDQYPASDSYTTADFNNDGHLDLLTPTIADANGIIPQSLTVSAGRGDGSFGAQVISPTNLTPNVVAAADLDEDGNLDAIAVGPGSRGGSLLGVLFGHGDGTLSGELDYSLPGGVTQVIVGDFNGDGRPDIAVAVSGCGSSCATGVYVLYGQTNRTFSTPSLIVSTPTLVDGATQPFLAAGDLNGDGLTDIVVVNAGFLSGNTLSTPGTIHVYLGKSNNSFTASTVAVPAVFFSDIVLADLNKDGKLDIVAGAADQDHNTQVDLLLGHGDGSFAAATSTLIAGGQADPAPVIAVADFDGDGNPDVAFFLAGDFSGVLFGAGNGALPIQVKMPVFSPVFPGAPRAVDLNGDKKPDLIFADANIASVVSLINQWGASTGESVSSTALTVAPNPVAAGQPVKLSAAIGTSAQGTPTGTVSFLSGTTVLGSSAVSAQGTAAFTTTFPAAGTASLTAQYSGDSTFAESVSNAVSLSVTAAKADFAITLNPAQGSAAAGASAAATVTLTPIDEFTGTVALACTGLPAGAACSFSPSSISINGSPVTSDLTVTTTTAVARVILPRRPLDPFAPASPALAGILASFAMHRGQQRRSRANRAWQWPGLLLVCVAVLHGCGGGSSAGAPPPQGGTPTGNYTITVTATAGATSHSTTYALTVN